MRFTTTQVTQIVNGKLEGKDINLDGVTQDSRTATANCLFVPLVAERDGHNYIENAIATGATAYLTNGPKYTDAVSIEVADTASALLQLGEAARTSIKSPVIGITGSVGKTSVKDLTTSVLTQRGLTHSSPRSFNNEIGVPLTLLNTPEEATAVVVEMGARHVGDIKQLCSVSRPDIGIITTVGAAHTELFENIETVGKAKGELIEGLPSEGCAILNADSQEVMKQASRTRAQILTFGEKGEIRASGIELDSELQPSFQIESPWGRQEVKLKVSGKHMVQNALAASAAGLFLGMELPEIAFGLSEGTLSPARMQLETASSGFLVINDAYNANPVSTKAALEALASLNKSGRKVAVLGLMAELGDNAREFHEEVAAYAHSLELDLLTVGTDLYGQTPENDIDQSLAGLTTGDAVLVKGSLVAGLQSLAQRLLEK
ncbi:MAG TPA: UDP-N-acetylmuramoyl-tripeptide--D-alanyl-D-alanine ligase [Acidimicrobiales bacterium]|nr:UDP-N-acetylmuramoyl-tripeptide--D-alanyl-D-alanine ligase [Acidimicrobiales bacterium]